MNDLDRINEIEKIFGIQLDCVEIDKLFNEEFLETDLGSGSNGYSINESGVVVGLALKSLKLALLPDDFIVGFQGLEKLRLSNVSISNYSFVTNAKSLYALDLTGNQIHNLSFLKGLKYLKFLNLSNNQISDTSFLEDLGNLSSLNLSFNQIGDGKNLHKLKSLTSLSLSSNRIRESSFLKTLKFLTSVDLSGNEISDISVFSGLTSLIHLNLRSNKIRDITPLGNLKALSFLDLSYNPIRDTSFLGGLTALTALHLDGNQISNASFISGLYPLTVLSLKNNQINDASFLAQLRSLEFLDISNNPIVNPPREIISRGLREIKNFYKQIEEQGTDHVYEAKMLIVGEPGAGKSTLFEKMKNPEYLPQNASKKKKTSTIGIRIESIVFPYTRDKSILFKANLWDFGGQPIQYILHQYFFTERSLYVLLADNRRQLTNFPYWFEIIATMGRGSPVLVVLNEIDHVSVSNFDLTEYRSEFGIRIKTIDKRDVDFSDNKDGRFALLRAEIENKLCNLPHIGQQLPTTWVNIRKKLEKESEERPYIEIDTYYKICADNGLGEKYARNLLRYFHDLGVALNYESDENLEDIVILNPNWVVDALYVVLRNADVKKMAGKFHRDFVFELWKKEGYEGRQDHKFLLSLMQMGLFEVAYKIGNTNEYIVPALLPSETPEYCLDETNGVNVYFQYEFMPPGLVSRLIVRLNQNIEKDQNGRQIVWEKGVLFEWEGSQAEVIESTLRKQIRIKVSGKNFIRNKEFITIIRNEINKIHKEWFNDRLQFKEMVPCNCGACQKADEPIFYSLDELQMRLAKGKSTIECARSYDHVSIRWLLEGVYLEEKERAYDSTFRINEMTIPSVKFQETLKEIETLRSHNLVDDSTSGEFKKIAVASLIIESVKESLSELTRDESEYSEVEESNGKKN